MKNKVLYFDEYDNFNIVLNKSKCHFEQKLNKFAIFPLKYLKWKILLKKYKLDLKICKASQICKDAFQKKINEQIEFYTYRDSFQDILLKKNTKKSLHWLKLKELLRLEPVIYFTSKLKFLLKTIKKFSKLKIDTSKNMIQRIRRDGDLTTNSTNRIIIILNVPQTTTLSQLKRFISVHGSVFSIFLKMFKRKERKEYVVQNVEIIWKRIEEAQLFKKIKNFSFPKKCFDGCLYKIRFGSMKKNRNFYFFRSAILRSFKLYKFFYEESKKRVLKYKSLQISNDNKITKEKAKLKKIKNIFELILKQFVGMKKSILIKKNIRKNTLRNVRSIMKKEISSLKRKLLKI